MYFAMQQCADKLAVDVVCAVPAVFRWPLRHVEMSAMIHQMNRLGVARRVDDPEGLRRGRPVASLPRRGTDAGGSWSAIWSEDRAPDTAHVTTKLRDYGIDVMDPNDSAPEPCIGPAERELADGESQNASLIGGAESFSRQQTSGLAHRGLDDLAIM
jgi:hypothetical protein